MAADPEKPRRNASGGIAHRPEEAERGRANEPESAEDPGEHRDVETAAETKENSV